MTPAPQTWRIIDTGPLDGPANMAIDEALLASFAADSAALPVLRLYGWQPPALSLGRYQRTLEVLDLDRCTAAGVPIVRRITGGGVIWHTHELTYSLACSPRHLPDGLSVKASFRTLTSFLHSFYHSLGLPAAWAVDTDPNHAALGERTAFCFAGRESYDIIMNGRKIGGNAQRRLKDAIFQHGSIPLVNRIEEGIGYLRQRPAGMAAATTSLAEEGVTAEREALVPLLVTAFRKAMGVELREDTLTTAERALAERLLAEKYRDAEWNLEGID
jgi:lipoate-protein ligase A